MAISTPARAGATEDFYAATNAARAGAGLPPLKPASDLAAVAQAWAEQMASTGKLAHNPNVQSQVKNWRFLGENVGTGGSVAAIQDAFMNSPKHRDNILDTDFTEFGIGTATRFNTDCACDVLYVTVNFRQPRQAAASPTPAPPAPPKPSPSKPATPSPAKPGAKPAAQSAKPAETKPSAKPTAVKPTPTPAQPPVSPLAENLKAQLTAAASQPSRGPEDPVSRALDFAALMASLGQPPG
jgi:hypothetical protein